MANDTSSPNNKTPSFEMTWGSSTSSGYCSEEDSDSELEQFFTARTSFFPKSRKAPVSENSKRVRNAGVWQKREQFGGHTSIYNFIKNISDAVGLKRKWFQLYVGGGNHPTLHTHTNTHTHCCFSLLFPFSV